MEVLGVIGVALIAVLCIAALLFLALVGMNIIDLSKVSLIVLAAFLGLVILAGAIWAFLDIVDLT